LDIQSAAETLLEFVPAFANRIQPLAKNDAGGNLFGYRPRFTSLR
jgi:hypothetical protein